MKYCVCLVLLIISKFVSAQFIETSVANGISLINDNPLFGNGTCFVDFDDDGWDDLTFAAKNQAVKFYKNNNGAFSEIFPSFTPSLPTSMDTKCVLWVDYDNDGDKDLLLTGIYTTIKVYKNLGNFNFQEVATSIGIIPETVQIYGISAGDLNNDGCLDLYVCKYHNHQLVTGYEYSNRVYQNNCDGTFTDVTVPAGFGTTIQASFASIWVDYNQDGFQDIYVINDRLNYANYLFRNDGDGTFTNVTASSGAGIFIEAMSATCDDYDNDNDLDIYVSNSPVGNVLLNYNSTTGFFINLSQSAGVSAFELCWAAMWLDYDNNTWQDLFVSTLGSIGTTEYQNLFFVSDGDGTFHLGITETGIVGDIDGTYTCAMGDYNQDGYYDYATNNTAPSNASLWLNDGGTNNWLSVSVEGTLSNKDGIGTWLQCFAGGNQYTRYTFCGENYLGQNSEREIFGLGNFDEVDSLQISWLSGLVETYYLPEINQHHHFIEGQSLSEVQVPILVEGELQICPGQSVQLGTTESNSYLWSNGDTTQWITAAQPGDYFVEVVGIYGFTQQSDTITISLQESPEPIVEIQHVSCFGGTDGTISIGIIGSIDSITWENGMSGADLFDLPAGEYSFSLTNSEGCEATGLISISQPDSMELVVTISDVLCFGDSTGTAQINISGGTPPYLVDWQGANPDSMISGTYQATITDSLFCSTYAQIVIEQPEELTLNLETNPEFEFLQGGTATIEIEGGIAPYLVEWSNGIDDFLSIDSLSAGFYSVEVTDSNNCVVQLNFTIEFVPYDGTSEIDFSGFLDLYPNPAEDFLIVSGNILEEVSEIRIFDSGGKLQFRWPVMYAESTIQLHISQLPAGVYQVTFTLKNGLTINRRVVMG